MLQQIRAHSGSLVIKIILSIIGASFVVFGIADVVRIIMATPPVAKMGKLRISFDEYYHLYGRYRAQLFADKAGDIAMTRAADEVLEHLISSKIMRHEPERMGIVAPLGAAQNLVKGIAGFQKNGQFDGELFAQTLASGGTSPQAFFAHVKQNLVDQQFLAPVVLGILLNQSYLDFLVDVMRRKRHFTVVELHPGIQNKSDVPVEKLEAWLRDNANKYEFAEERSVRLLVLAHDVVAAGITLLEQDINDELSSRTVKASEKRDIHAVVFDSESDAHDAQKVVLAEKSVSGIKRVFPDATVYSVDVSTLPSAVHEALAARDEWIPWGPVAVGRKHAIYVVTKITKIPGQTVSREAVEQELKRRKLPGKIEQLKNSIEDELACDTPIEDVAKNANAKILVAEFNRNNAIDRLRDAGLDDKIANLVIEQAFELDQKNCDSPFLDSSDCSVLVRVSDVKEKRIPPLESVKAQVLEDYRKHEQVTKRFEHLSQFFGEAQDDFSLWKKAIAQTKLKVKMTEIKASRLDIMAKSSPLSDMFPPETIARLMLQKNHSLSFEKNNAGTPVCVIVTGTSLDDAADALNTEKIEGIERAKQAFLEQSSSDRIRLVTNSVVESYPVKINEKVKNTVNRTD
jgi:peptidyl-prolyl cis-trans isomerase D